MNQWVFNVLGQGEFYPSIGLIDWIASSICDEDIVEYNKKFKSRKLNPNDGHQFLPYIVLVVDEFADLIIPRPKLLSSSYSQFLGETTTEYFWPCASSSMSNFERHFIDLFENNRLVQNLI